MPGMPWCEFILKAEGSAFEASQMTRGLISWPPSSRASQSSKGLEAHA
jgi:hypothetical protein